MTSLPWHIFMEVYGFCFSHPEVGLIGVWQEITVDLATMTPSWSLYMQDTGLFSLSDFKNSNSHS